MNRPDASSRRRAQRGVSIVEIMVGLVVALLVGLAATGSAAVFSASQRQGVGSGGMTVNAATALAAIKSDAASAGLGFFGNSSFLCYALDLSVGAAVKLDAASFSPVRITAGTNSDQLDVVFANSVDAGANVLLKGTSDGTSASLQSLLPVTSADVGKAVLLVPKDPAVAGKTCVVRTITAVTDSTDDTAQSLTFASTGAYNGGAFTTTPSFKESDKDEVALLGALQWSRYRVIDGSLTLERPIDGTSAVLVRNVMAFRTQYGVSATSGSTDTTMSAWQKATGATFASVAGDNVNRVRALRIGLVTRSSQREKLNKAGECEASSAKPQLFGEDVEPDVSDWQCYRYRTAVVIVPLRNLAW